MSTAEQPTLFLDIEDSAHNWPSILLLTVAGIALVLVWVFCVYPVIPDLIAKIVATIVFVGVIIVGEYFLYKWMAKNNIFGVTGLRSQDTDMIRIISMTVYAAVVTILYRSIMRRIETSASNKKLTDEEQKLKDLN